LQLIKYVDVRFFHRYDGDQYQVPLGLIGNPVKIGNGPAAVILPVKRNPYDYICHCVYPNMGRLSMRAEKSEDLPDIRIAKLRGL
jgi:hypothetical protein